MTTWTPPADTSHEDDFLVQANNLGDLYLTCVKGRCYWEVELKGGPTINVVRQLAADHTVEAHPTAA